LSQDGEYKGRSLLELVVGRKNGLGASAVDDFEIGYALTY